MLLNIGFIVYLTGCLAQYVVLATVIDPRARERGGDFLFCALWPLVWWHVCRYVGRAYLRRWRAR